MEQLSGLDAAFVQQESRRTPMHVTAVLIYDVGASPNASISCPALREIAASRLQEVPVFRRKLKRVPMGMDTPYWIDASNPDWNMHIKEVSLEADSDWRDFHALLSTLHSEPLNLSRPLWEMRLVNGLTAFPGLPDSCQAVVLKIHHAAIDGMSMAAIIDGMHTEQSPAGPGPRRVHREVSQMDLWTRANFNFAGRQRKLASTLKNLVPGLARARETSKEFSDLPPVHGGATVFNRYVTEVRETGSVLLPREQVFEIKRAVRRVTLNDIALACVSGGIRGYLKARGKLARESLACGAPISLRSAGDKDIGGNKIATMVVGLATHIADPVERLRMIHRYAVAGKKKISALGTGTVMDLSDSVTPALLAEGIRTMALFSQVADAMLPFHTMVSNVPGPSERLFLGEAELVVPLGLGPVRDNLGLFHIVSGGPELMSLSFSASGNVFRDASAYERCLRESFEELLGAASKT